MRVVVRADIRGLSLCAGIGGFDLGLRLALGPRYRTVGYVERDAYAAAVLVARLGEAALDQAVVWDDIATFDGWPWRGSVDLVSAGFPCQDISGAGKGEGIQEGNRSGLWYEVARVVREVGPGWVVLENVSAITSRGLGVVLGDLAELGFDAEWDVFSAAGVGAPHLRRRFFLVARRIPDTLGDALRDEPERMAGPALSADSRDAIAGLVGDDALGRRRAMEDPDRDGRTQVPDEIAGEANSLADSVLEGLERPELLGRSPDQSSARDAVGSMADADGRGREGERQSECAREQGGDRGLADGRDLDRRFPWPPGPGDARAWIDYLGAGGAEPAIRRGADGAASRVDRLRCLGNGIVPIVAARAIGELVARAGWEI